MLQECYVDSLGEVDTVRSMLEVLRNYRVRLLRVIEGVRSL